MKTPATAPWAKTAFGIDQTEDGYVIVKASRSGRGLVFTNIEPTALALATPSPQSVIVGCMLQRESFTRWVVASIASARKAESVFPSLLDIQLPFSVEDCEVALVETRPTSDRTGTRGWVVGARAVDVEKRLSTFASLGEEPHLLDQEGIALWTQSLEEVPPVTGGAELRIVVYQSSERVTLALGRNNEFMGAHTMRQLDEDQVHRILKSYFTTPPPATQWLITGPGATLAGDGISPLGSLAKRWPGTQKITREPNTFLARALAARALTPGVARCNLRTGRFLHATLAQRQAKRPFQWAAACLFAGLLLCAVNLAWLVMVTHRATDTQRALRALAIEITGSPLGIPAGQEVLTARRAIESQTKNMEPFLSATDTPLPKTLKTVLAVAHEEGLSLETMVLGRKNLVIHGTTPTWAQAEKASRRLNDNGWIATLERKDSPPGEERVAFVIGLGRSHEKK
ncbi:MAG: hypothetical protein WCO42_06025 [bacterium]